MLACLKPFEAAQGSLTPTEKHALVVCSLVMVPKVTGLEGLVIQPTDFSTLSMIEWADLIQAVATGMRKVPFELRHSVDATAIPVLIKLARVVGVSYCDYCCFPEDQCLCGLVVPQSGSTQAASVPSTTTTAPVYSMASSTGAATAVASVGPSVPHESYHTPFQFTAPPPGLFGPTVPTWGSVTAQLQQESSQTPLQARKVGLALDTPFPTQAPPKKTSVPTTTAPATQAASIKPPQPMDTTPAASHPQGPSIRQQRPTTQQQGAGAPRGPQLSLRGRPRNDFRPPLTGAARDPPIVGPHGPRVSRPPVKGPVGSAGRGTRPRTPSNQGRTPKGPPVGSEAALEAAPVVEQGQGEPAEGSLQGSPASQGSQAASLSYQEARPYKRRNRNTGWRKELPGILSRGMKSEHLQSLEGSERTRMKQKVIDYLADNLKEWSRQREDDPLGFGPYLAGIFLQVNGVEAPGLNTECIWITPGSYYHWRLIQLDQVARVEHLRDAPRPIGQPRRPSSQTLVGHSVNYSQALAAAKSSAYEWRRAGVEDMAARRTAIEADRLLVRLRSGYAQTLEIEGLSLEAASHPRPLAGLPQAFQDSAELVPEEPLPVAPVVVQEAPPAPAAPVVAEARQAPAAHEAAETHQAPAVSEAAVARPAQGLPTVGEAGPSFAAPVPPKQPASQPKKEGWHTVGKKRPNKRRMLEQPTFEESKNWAPDMLRDEPGRVRAIQTMIREARRLKFTTCPRLFEVLKACYPGNDDDYYRRWANGIFCSLQAHISMCSCRPSVAVPMVLPDGLENFLPPAEDYTQAQEFMRSYDLREAERMKVLRVLVWLQHCEQLARYGRRAQYFVDPVSQTEIRLTQMFVDSGVLQISLDAVCMRAAYENQALVGTELEKARSELPQLHRDLAATRQKLQKRLKAVESAANPVTRKNQVELADHLETTIDQLLAKIRRLEGVVKDHSARLDYLKAKYSNEEDVKTSMSEVEAGDSGLQPAEEENMEVETGDNPEQPPEAAQEAVITTERPSASAQEVATPAGCVPAQTVQARQAEASTEAEQASPPEVEVQTGEDQEDDDDRVSINAPVDDNLLAGEDGGGQSPPTTEDERALMHAATESPGVSEDMSTLTVAADAAPQ